MGKRRWSSRPERKLLDEMDFIYHRNYFTQFVNKEILKSYSVSLYLYKIVHILKIIIIFSRT